MRKKRQDALLVLFAILLQFGNNYAFDLPQALETEIESGLRITQVEFNLLYSVFALPNVGLSVGGGMMIDRIGGRWGLLTFAFLMFMSQFMIALGGAYEKFYMMLMGRAIFGVSSDMLAISISKVLLCTVSGRGLVMGLVLTVPELAGALNSFLSPYLFERSQSLTAPLLFSLTVCLFSFICALIMIAMVGEPQQTTSEGQVRSFNELKPHEDFFPMMIICTLALAVYQPFLDNVTEFYEERFGWSTQKAGRVVMIGYVIAATSSPCLGILSDKSKDKKLLIVFSTLLFVASHLQFLLLKTGTQQLPNYFSIFGLMTLGLAYASYSAIITPAFQELIPQEYFATAMGTLGVAENLCLAGVPMLSGTIYDKYNNEKGMRAADCVYLFMSFLALGMSIKLYCRGSRYEPIIEIEK